MTLRALRPLAALLLAAVVLALGPTPAARAALPPPSDTEFSEARILWLINEERRIHGLPPVTRHAGADQVAQYSANVQAWYGQLGHNPNLGIDTTKWVGPWWFVGENVGCAADADRLHFLWMSSPGHRSNVLHGGVDTVGIGTVYARGCLWATVDFADRQ